MVVGTQREKYAALSLHKPSLAENRHRPIHESVKEDQGVVPNESACTHQGAK
jgi:hypothetical protein